MPDVPRLDAIEWPREDRFPRSAAGYSEAMSRHRRAVTMNEAGYLDPSSGLFVLTARYLAERSWCCDNGCRHCPY